MGWTPHSFEDEHFETESGRVFRKLLDLARASDDPEAKAVVREYDDLLAWRAEVDERNLRAAAAALKALENK